MYSARDKRSLPFDVTVAVGETKGILSEMLTYHQLARIVREVVATPVDQGSLQFGGVDFARTIAIYHLEPLLSLWRHLSILRRKCSGRSCIAGSGLAVRVISLSLWKEMR